MSITPKSSRTYDIVVWGATGFTGGLVAKYLARTQASSIKWAIAGRNTNRLAEIKKSLVATYPAAANVAILIGDAKDQLSVDKIVGDTRVILTTAGPFYTFGEPVVAACARLGTDYVDSTGETWWLRSMIDRYADEARRNNAIIISMCGFDSIPADIGAFFIANHMHTELKQKCRNVTSVVSMEGGASGGTYHSMMNVRNLPMTVLKAFSHPFYLAPGRTRNPPKDGSEREVSVKDALRAEDVSQRTPVWNKEAKSWTIPFVMAVANESCVRRSNALKQRDDGVGYGEEFSYRECMRVPNLITGVIVMAALAIFSVLIFASRYLSFIATLIFKVLPQPGSGPSEKFRAKCWFRYQYTGITVDQQVVRGVLQGGEPGYDETSVMLAECALALATQRDDLPLKHGGIVTPSYALGNVLVKRLQASDTLTLKIVPDFSRESLGAPRKQKAT